MALIKLGPLVAGIRGSIEGMTFSNGPGGLQVRRKAKPARRVRSTQPANRSIIGYLARSWGTLTSDQRTAWKGWALVHPGINKFGDEFIMSGSNAFIRLNHPANRLGGVATFNPDPPVDNLDIGMKTLEATDGIVDGQIILTWTHNGTGDPADFNESAVAGPFNGPGRESVTNYSFSNTVGGDLLTTTIDGLTPLAWYWLRTRYVKADGQTSAWLYQHWQAPDVI